MSTFKQIQQAEKSALKQQEVITELNNLARQIDRAAETINNLQAELAAVSAKYPSKRTTREDIAFLTDLLKCANKKLAWEKQIASLQKRTPAIMEELSSLMSDPLNPPDDPTK